MVTKARIIEERDQLCERWKKLTMFLATDIYPRLPIDEQRRLVCQQHIMSIYLNILEERIVAWPAHST